MLLVHCPVCGAEGDETDFHGGGQAHVRRPATHDPVNISDEAQRDYLFIRHNREGLHFERWRCDRGCGKVVPRGTRYGDHGVQGLLRHHRIAATRIDGTATGEWAEYFKDKLKAGN